MKYVYQNFKMSQTLLQKENQKLNFSVYSRLVRFFVGLSICLIVRYQPYLLFPLLV